MTDSSKSDMITKIEAEYHKQIKDLESKMAINRKELTQIDHLIEHEKKTIEELHYSSLTARRKQVNGTIQQLEREIKRLKPNLKFFLMFHFTYRKFYIKEIPT